MDKWVEISKEAAIRQGLYGIRGWLLTLALYLLIVFCLTLYFQLTIFSQLYSSADLMRNADAQALRLVIFIDLLLAAVVLFTLFTKYNAFRLLASWLFSLKILVNLMNAFIITVKDENLMIFIYNAQQIVVITLWLIYINKSERVRLTFEHKILQ